MTQRSSEMHVARSAAEDAEPLDAPTSDSKVVASEFRARSAPAAGADDAAPGEPGARRGDDDAGASEPGALAERIDRLERHNRRMRYAVLLLVAISGFAIFDEIFPEGVKIQKTMMESKELTLLDNDGNARLFMRMYSRVPVLQILDSNGKPRMSLGLRFDDTPFIDLSDETGRTRATFEMTEQDAPALRLFDERGNTTFAIN